MRTYGIALLLLAAVNTAGAQQLERRSFLGIQMEPVSDSLRQAARLPATGGVRIRSIIPASTAAAAGLQPGDILLSLDGHALASVPDAVTYVGSRKGGMPVAYELIRNGKKISGHTVLKEFPRETYRDLEVTYAGFSSPLGQQRMILSRPKGAGKLPVVVFIGGYGCYSLDAPADTGRSELQLLHTLARAGFATVRLEKPGIGDGAGYSKPCNEVTFLEEAASYAAAVKTLKSRKDLQADAIYIFGHSMGGVMAPLVAQQTAIKGIIAYGTMGSNYVEYLLKTRRTIGEAYGWAPEVIDSFVKEYNECAAWYFVDKMTTKEIAAAHPECAERLSVFDLRARSYNDQLYRLNLPGTWQPYDGYALFLWGEADFISSRHDHELLNAAVNYYHPDHGEFIAVPGADHGMHQASSFGQAAEAPGPYNGEVARIVLRWLQQRQSATARG